MLCVYGINIFTLSVRGSTLESNVHRRQIWTSKVDSRTVGVNHVNVYADIHDSLNCNSV